MFVASVSLQLFEMQRFHLVEIAFIQSVPDELHTLAIGRNDGLRKSCIVPRIGFQPIESLVLEENLHESI